MLNWVKRYLILTLCFVMVFIPLLSLFNEFGIVSEEPIKTIFWIVFAVIAIAYYVIMTILMINGDKKNKDSSDK